MKLPANPPCRPKILTKSQRAHNGWQNSTGLEILDIWKQDFALSWGQLNYTGLSGFTLHLVVMKYVVTCHTVHAHVQVRRRSWSANQTNFHWNSFVHHIVAVIQKNVRFISQLPLVIRCQGSPGKYVIWRYGLDDKRCFDHWNES
jgi:hypothetical protein